MPEYELEAFNSQFALQSFLFIRTAVSFTRTLLVHPAFVNFEILRIIFRRRFAKLIKVNPSERNPLLQTPTDSSPTGVSTNGQGEPPPIGHSSICEIHAKQVRECYRVGGRVINDISRIVRGF